VKAQEVNFLKFLNKSDQLQIPIYQRTYSWTRDECFQLWKDIVRASQEDASGHFVGSIVYIDTGVYRVAGSNAIEVIDGQQRLTTISLLLLALARAHEHEGSSGAARKILRDYLLHEDDEDHGSDARYKLLLTKGDRETFVRLVDNIEVASSEAPRIVETYGLFVDQISRTDPPPRSRLGGCSQAANRRYCPRAR
jgi:uncharacterized protein with ParB-like and HNH nuclease domain